MADWVIGDIHGCWRTLTALLERLEWQPGGDRLWLIGDLVNKGPGSLEVLRWAEANRATVDSVLGNHDLLLIAQADGTAPRRSEDAFDEVLAAPDRERLIGWLRTRPLLARAADLVMVHAGVWPDWSWSEASENAAAVAREVAAPAGLGALYARRRTLWRDDLVGIERIAAAGAVLTRLRMIGPDGLPRLTTTVHPAAAPADLVPWFDCPRLVAEGLRVVFGHWAMLGLLRAGAVTCIDSACVYGGALTAMRISDGELVQQPLLDEVRSEK